MPASRRVSRSTAKRCIRAVASRFPRPPDKGVAVTNSHEITCDARNDSTNAWSILVRGEVDMATAPRLADVIDDTIGKGAHVIIVRLEHVSFIDSAGLGVLLKGAQRLEAVGGKLFLEGATPVVERILKVSGIIERLRRDTEEET
jgi:anti-anti-sigma factor